MLRKPSRSKWVKIISVFMEMSVKQRRDLKWAIPIFLLLSHRLFFLKYKSSSSAVNPPRVPYFSCRAGFTVGALFTAYPPNPPWISLIPRPTYNPPLPSFLPSPAPFLSSSSSSVTLGTGSLLPAHCYQTMSAFISPRLRTHPQVHKHAHTHTNTCGGLPQSEALKHIFLVLAPQ